MVQFSFLSKQQDMTIYRHPYSGRRQMKYRLLKKWANFPLPVA